MKQKRPTLKELNLHLRKHRHKLYKERGGVLLHLSNKDLSGRAFRGDLLDGAYMAESNLSYCRMRGSLLRSVCLVGCNLQNADLAGSSLKKANLRRADLCGANLSGCDLTGAHLRNAKFDDSTQWPSPTMILLAYWGSVSRKLTKQLMAYDAHNHPDPNSFNKWKRSYQCPYFSVNVQRAAHFQEDAAWWARTLLKQPPPSAYELAMALLEECCEKVPVQEEE